jgi:CrcB protein
MMSRFLWICAGGALGTGARYAITLWAARSLSTAFPAGTLIVNVAGSFLIGFAMHFAETTEVLHPTARLALTTGVLGGFTTYSSFNYETIVLLRSGDGMDAAVNVIATFAGCMVAGFAGISFARLLVGR